MAGTRRPSEESPDRPSLFSPDSRAALTIKEKAARTADNLKGVTVSSNKYGAIRKITNDEWGVDLYRVPTHMTPEEKLYSEQCRASVPPATYRHNYHSPAMSQMLRCPIGGGSCNNGLINVRNSKAAINSHFNMHHRCRGKFYHLKIEGANNAYTYSSFPLGRPPTDTQGEGTLKGTVGRGPETQPETMPEGRNRQPLIAPIFTDRSQIATPIIGMDRLRPPKKRRDTKETSDTTAP